MNWIVGLPGQPGWYYASGCRTKEFVRHFDGTAWSASCWPDDPGVIIARAKSRRVNAAPEYLLEPIAWGDTAA